MALRQIGFCVALLAVLGLGFVGEVPAQQKITLKLAWVTADSELDPFAIGCHAFKREVERRSGGRIEMKLYPNRQLGDEKQIVEGLRFGTIDMGLNTSSIISTIVPAFQINEMPFLYSGPEQGRPVIDGKLGEILTKKLEPHGVIALCFMEGGFRHMINNVRPVFRTEDLKGVKYRVMQNPLYIDMFALLGGNGVPMAWSETFTAVQQGTIDGLENSIGVIYAMKFYEISKYLSLTNHVYSMPALMISKKTFGKLPADLHSVVREAAKAARDMQRIACVKNEEKQLDEMQKKGLKVNKVGDFKQFRNAVKPMYEKYKSSIGEDLMREVLQAVE